MKRILLTLLILSSVSFVRAQSAKSSSVMPREVSSNRSNLKFGLSVNPGLSLGNAGSDFVLGGALSLYKILTANLEATFSAGYTQFFYGRDIQKGGLIPVKAGLQYALNPRFYVGAQAGVAFSTTDGGAYFVYSPSVGLRINKQVDVAFKYDHFSNEPSVLGINLTYKFEL